VGRQGNAPGGGSAAMTQCRTLDGRSFPQNCSPSQLKLFIASLKTLSKAFFEPLFTSYWCRVGTESEVEMMSDNIFQDWVAEFCLIHWE
jgi:hypothetical protein